MQAEHGEDLQVALADLTAAERAAFEAELASGRLARLVLPWEPWWRSPEAQHLSLSAAGTRLLHDPGAPSCLKSCWLTWWIAQHYPADSVNIRLCPSVTLRSYAGCYLNALMA